MRNWWFNLYDIVPYKIELSLQCTEDVFQDVNIFFNGINGGQYFILIGTKEKKHDKKEKKCHDEIYLNFFYDTSMMKMVAKVLFFKWDNKNNELLIQDKIIRKL